MTEQTEPATPGERLRGLIADYGDCVRLAGRHQALHEWTGEAAHNVEAGIARDLAWIEINKLYAAGVEAGRREVASGHEVTLTDLRRAIADPGAFTARLQLEDGYDGHPGYEPMSVWSARAVKLLVDRAVASAHAAGVSARQVTEAALKP